MSLEHRDKLKEVAFVVGGETLRLGEIPSISVVGLNLPEAWERAVLATWEFGAMVPTEYDQSIDPDSRDSTTMIVILKPLSEPRIHKFIPDSYVHLEVYRQEVVNGIHNHYVKESGWSYSYNDRVKNWPGVDGWKRTEELVGKELDLPHVDQIDAMIKKLAKTPYTRRAQAITWNPLNDNDINDPPCLQRIWCRLVKSTGDEYLLEMNTHWRSRDAFKAAFMNIYALTDWQREIAEEISLISGRKVGVGRYVDISDSFHIYGSYIRKGEIDSWLRSLETMTFEERTLRSDHRKILYGKREANRLLEAEKNQK